MTFFDVKKKIKKLNRLFSLLNSSILIVEGKNDFKAMREAGIVGEIIQANGKTEVIIKKVKEKIHENDVVLLFDFDSEGERKTKYFSELFFSEDIKVNCNLRKALRSLLGFKTFEEFALKKQEFERKLLEVN